MAAADPRSRGSELQHEEAERREAAAAGQGGGEELHSNAPRWSPDLDIHSVPTGSTKLELVISRSRTVRSGVTGEVFCFTFN